MELTLKSVLPKLKSSVFMCRSFKKLSVFACEIFERSKSKLKNIIQAQIMMRKSIFRTTD